MLAGTITNQHMSQLHTCRKTPFAFVSFVSDYTTPSTSSWLQMAPEQLASVPYFDMVTNIVRACEQQLCLNRCYEADGCMACL